MIIQKQEDVTPKVLDAYKNIDEVMEHARDLVEVKFILKQFINVKGD